MIPLTRGFSRSVNRHNTATDVLADWMEASTLFSNDVSFSASEAVDYLLDEEIYDSQDFCWEKVDEGLNELRRRSSLSAAYPLSLADRRIDKRVGDWREVPAHSFLVLLTLAQRFGNWTEVMPIDYPLQGELFEDVTRETLVRQLPDWVVHPTGWSKTHPAGIQELVTEIAGRLGELPGEVKAWTDPDTKDAGLDLLCYRPFPDGNVGVPLLLLQCASGDWESPGKLKTPDIDIWIKIISFASHPKRGFATHFAFLRSDFRRVSGRVNGVLLDRYRLLGTEPETNWLSDNLRTKLLEWDEARISRLSDLV